MAQDLSRSQTNVTRGAQSTGNTSPARRRGDLWMSPDDFFRMNPFQLMRHFSDEMDRMWSGGFGREHRGEESMSWRPKLDVRERDGQLTVSAELPGVNEKDVKVAIENDMLVIQGERKHEEQREDEGIYRSEMSYGSFHRTIPLPEGAEADKANARFNNGVLEITMPVPKSRQSSRQIPISTSSQIGSSQTGSTHTGTAGTHSTQEKTTDKTSRAGGA